MNNQILVFVLCDAFILGVVIMLSLHNAKKDKVIAMKDEIIAGKNDYILRLYAELKKEKGIDKPFMMPLDPAPDFDIAAVFKAAEEETKEEEAKAEEAAEEVEEGGAA